MVGVWWDSSFHWPVHRRKVAFGMECIDLAVIFLWYRYCWIYVDNASTVRNLMNKEIWDSCKVLQVLDAPRWPSRSTWVSYIDSSGENSDGLSNILGQKSLDDKAWEHKLDSIP